MNDWKETTLGQHLGVITDYHANGSYEILKKNVELKDTVDYAVMIRTTNFENDDFFVNLKYINRNAYEFLSKSKVMPSDILMNKIANAGSVYFMPNLNRPVSLAMNLFLLRTNKKTTNQRYIYEYLKFNEGYIKQFAIGTATVTITKQAVKNLKIILPPLEIQDKIAAILSAYDDLIENNKRRITLLENMAEEIYREWFVRFRFPNYKNAEFEKGIPKGWVESSLGKIANIQMGQSPKSEFYNTQGEGLPFHQGVGSYGNRFPINDTYCSVEGRVAYEGEILFSVRAPVGRINIANTKMIIGRGLAALSHKKGFNTYLLYLLKLAFANEDIIGNGSIFNSVGKDELNNFKLFLPPEHLIALFEKIASPIDTEIKLLLQSQENLEKTKSMLLPRLISGKLTVEKLNIQFPPSMV
ncbi:MAG: restriction endonuclease subunit S [Agitococcus sp.]|nr:restriction endonuclease subunit S [Agitococcus sp.]